MNFFEFLWKTIIFASQGFGQFIVTFLLLLTTGVLLTAVVGALTKFRLFEINKSKSPENQISKLGPTSNNTDPQQANIYDMLVDAYDRYKAKKNGKDTDTDSD